MLNRFKNFTALISDINRSVQKLEKSEMEKYGYRGAFAQYLLILQAAPDGLSISQLCEKSDRDKAAVSRIVSEMAEKGLVQRQGEDSRVYRARFTLTEEGQKAADFVCARAQSAVDAVGQALSDEQRSGLYTALNIISENLERLTLQGIPEEGENNG